MNENLTARVSITVDAPPNRVWEALTRPDMIQKYLFGTEVTTDWQVGSSITYRGIWQGKPYEDKGKLLIVNPEKLLVSTYWSPLSGLPDTPENYKTVQYELSSQGAATELTLTQDNNASEEEVQHSEQNWKMVLEGIKKLIEG